MMLHINSYYFTNKVHFHFRTHLNVEQIEPSYFIPVYKGRSRIFEDPEVQPYRIYGRFDKYLFFLKIAKSVFTIFQLGDPRRYKLIHCHTFFSDGMIGYVLSLMTNRPFIISVRNTDVNVFLKYNLFRLIGKLILRKASAVMFLSPAYKRKIQGTFPDLNRKYTFILPSGLDSYWFKNKGKVSKIRKEQEREIQLLFVGRIDKNKNLSILIEFLKKHIDYSYTLHVIGENIMNYDFDALNCILANHGSNTIKYWGVMDKQNLLRFYRESHLFVLLSLKESFGISYLEALSQGTPVIYTRNEGIDGLFPDGHVGYSCDPSSVKELKKKVDLCLSNYNELSRNALDSIDRYQWRQIMKEYNAHIHEILNKEVNLTITP